MAINSRLLACKAELAQALYYAKPMLRVGPYFQVLALAQLIPLLTFTNQLYSNHYNKPLLFRLIKQELQAINYSKAST
jgi:hypothetical protein